MFEIGGTELLLIAIVALLVIGPKELPNALRQVGKFTGKARAMTRHLRSGFDEMMRQAEIEEMEKQWQDHNRKIMESTPQDSPLQGEATRREAAAGGVSDIDDVEPFSPVDPMAPPAPQPQP